MQPYGGLDGKIGLTSDLTLDFTINPDFGLRLQKDYNKGNTIFGGMITATNRSIKNDELNFLHDAAYSGGFDFIHQWKDKTYFFSLKTVFSHVLGRKEAILRTQESPVRYFQRPDTDHVNVDPNRTSLSGHGGTINFLQFRMNLVLRWEYIPGSTLYLVWSQGRAGISSFRDFSFREGIRDLFSVHSNNAFLIKFSYCFQL